MPSLYAVSWSSVPKLLNNVHRMAWLAGSKFFSAASPNQDNSETINFENAASILANVPKGRKTLFLWFFGSGLYTHPRDSGPWAGNAAEQMRQTFDDLVRDDRFAALDIDAVVMDNEERGRYSSWELKKTPPLLADVMSSSARMSPFLNVSPCTNITLVSPSRPGSFASFSSVYDQYNWDTYNGEITAAMFNMAIRDTLWNVYPNVSLCNYDGYLMNSVEASPDLNGNVYESRSLVGSHHSPALYGQIAGFGDCPKTAWGSFLMDVNAIRAISRTDSKNSKQPWIGDASWSGDHQEIFYPQDQLYHDEMVRHAAMQNVKNFLYFNPQGNDVDAKRLDSVLNDINVQFRNFDTTTPKIVSKIAWNNSEFVVSALESSVVKNKMLYRITAAPGVRKVTFNGRLIVIPPNQRGVWIVDMVRSVLQNGFNIKV